MKTVQDFNYKVALASGLKHLQANRLRQAEEQFRYLVSKFPKADGGYRGLARVQVELGDRAAALATLREGAAVMSKAGDRDLAIGLLREGVQLDPMDLAVHRRLASALALKGDASGAAAEYMRYTQLEMTSGDPERAKLEAQYAIETLGEIPALHELARSAGIGLRTVRAEPAARPAPEPRPAGAPIDERTSVFGRVEPAEPVAAEPAAASGWEVAAEAAPAEPAVAPTPAPEPAAAPSPSVDPLRLDETAAILIARKDPGAGRAALEAASALLEAGKTHAASDLLLALVASGTAVHDAELELIAVANALGRKDIATDRAALLANAMRLAGEEERAAQVERIAQTL